jgi:uncharacterized membrane protein YeaQ/YmgE (transglycosylase-associated protein family)
MPLIPFHREFQQGEKRMSTLLLLLAIDTTGLLIFLVIGAVAGWLAGTLMKGGGFGLIGNLIVGIIGAFLGGMIFNWLGITLVGGLVGSLITATIGALVLLFIVSLVKKA